VVTGGNRGIGLEICRQLASGGVTVVLTARDAERGAEAASKLGLPNVVFHQLDVGDPSSAARLAGFIEEKFGRLDILVCHGRLISRSSCCDLYMRIHVHVGRSGPARHDPQKHGP
jgi:(+)-neomenthol dehydrogenase